MEQVKVKHENNRDLKSDHRYENTH